MTTTKLQVLARPIRRGILGRGAGTKWMPAIYRGGDHLIDLPADVDASKAIEACAIATRAINENADPYEIGVSMPADVVALAAEIAREART